MKRGAGKAWAPLAPLQIRQSEAYEPERFPYFTNFWKYLMVRTIWEL